LLRQPQYSPYPVEEQVVSIWAGTKGKLDTLEVTDVLRFEKELLDHLRRNTKILDTLRDTNVLDDKTESDLEAEIDKFVVAFQGGKNGGVKPGSEEFDALPDEAVEQAKIVKPRKRK
jgi:F-type H+-transporting ATPase subunit alpha